MAALVEEGEGLGAWIDSLSEKGKASRLSGLNSLLRSLSHKKQSIDGHAETLVGNLKAILKKAKDEEFAKACKLVQVLAVSVSDSDGKWMMDELKDILLASDSEHAIQCLATLCFFCNEEEDTLNQVMERMDKVFTGFVQDEPRVEALRGWGLLATLLDKSTLKHLTQKYLKIFQGLLSFDCLDVQIEAGENISFLLEEERKLDSHIPQTKEGVSEQGIVVDDQSKFVDKETAKVEAAAVEAAQERHASLPPAAEDSVGEEDTETGEDSVTGDEEGEIDHVWLSELITSLEDLSYESNKARTKKDQKEQRARFRDILACVREEASPEVKITVEKTVVTLDNWTDIKRLTFIKEVLGEGFIAHFKESEILHQVFDLEALGLDSHLAGTKLVNMDGKLYYKSGRTKEETVERNKARAKREAVKQDFMTQS